MKKIFGMCLLVIALIIIGGCTQNAPAQTATPVPTVETTPELAATPDVNTTNMTPSASNVPTQNVTVETTTAVVTMVPTTPAPATTPVVSVNMIHIRNNTFVPAVTTVLPGTGITWINDDPITHVVKAQRAGAAVFNSGDIVSGSQWSYAFGSRLDTYTVTDPAFSMMTGTVIVKKEQVFIMNTPTPRKTA